MAREMEYRSPYVHDGRYHVVDGGRDVASFLEEDAAEEYVAIADCELSASNILEAGPMKGAVDGFLYWLTLNPSILAQIKNAPDGLDHLRALSESWTRSEWGTAEGHESSLGKI